MKRWVGLGVIADNLVSIGRAINNKGGSSRRVCLAGGRPASSPKPSILRRKVA
jgi:hypothetical protein